MKLSAFSVCLLQLFILLAVCAKASVPDVSLFFKNPEFSNFQISPDGKYLAALAPWDGYMNLYSINLETRQPMILTGESIDVTDFEWVNNDRLVYSMNQGVSSTTAQTYAGGLFAVNKDGSDLENVLLPFRASRGDGGKFKAKNYRMSFAHRYPAEEDYILVESYQRRANYPDLFLVNIENQRTRRLENNPGRVNQFFIDKNGKVRGGLEVNDESAFKFYYRSADGEDWETLDHFEQDYEAWTPVAFDYEGDPNLIVVSSNQGRDTRGLYVYDLAKKEISKEPIYAVDGYDVTGSALYGLRSDRFVGIRYDTDKPQVKYFEKNHQMLQSMLDDALPNAFNRITSVDDRGTKAVITSITDTNAPQYFLMDLKTLQIEPLAPSMPWLKDLNLVEQRPIEYKARDGRTIHGYLFLPKGANGPVPLIVNPHGGPWARDNWGIQSWHGLEPQFLVSRGFAVLQVNFRGSTGYGKDHLQASFKKMEDMHNDVIDGVRWAIKEGYADASNIGVMGASWGGTATMTAIVKEPDMFQFAVNIFGVVDFPEHIKTYKSWDRDSAYNYWLHRIGDPTDEKDLAYLNLWSPINYVEKIRCPVFVYHGLRDFNVDIEQSRMLESELKKHGIPHEVLYRSDEAHSAFDEDNRIELYRKIDAFLKPFAPVWKN